jgi:hypothetical protein
MRSIGAGTFWSMMAAVAVSVIAVTDESYQWRNAVSV